jgi:hypothetical protein
VKKKKMKTKNMKAISTLVVVALLTLVAFSATASATDRNVPADYSTIQDAINAAANGDTIIVADSTYTITVAINVNKGVTITGNVANPENVVVQYSPASTSLNGFEIGAADITIQGFKIIDCFRGVHFGRSDVTSTGCTITNCVFDNNSENAIGEVAAENTTISNNAITNCNMGIEIRANEATSIAKRTEVTGNTISSCSQSCIQIYLGKYVYIYGNTISSTNDKGINIIRPTATGTLDRIQVIGNTISETKWPGIQTDGGKYTYIYDNTISSTNDKGINIIKSGATGTADRVQVIGNTIFETKWPGIQVIGSPYTYVYSNTLTKCNYYGGDSTGDWDYASIHVEDDGAVSGANVIIDSNTVSDGINGIQTWSDNCEITNNSIYDMGLTYANTKITADGTYYNSGIIIGSNWLTNNFKPAGTTITCNNIHDNYWGLYVRDYATLSPDDPIVLSVTAENNWWGHASGPSGPDGRTTKKGKEIGKGDAVSANVDWDPWLPQPVGHTPHDPVPPGLRKGK